jgi:nucleoid DNA-binding protein
MGAKTRLPYVEVIREVSKQLHLKYETVENIVSYYREVCFDSITKGYSFDVFEGLFLKVTSQDEQTRKVLPQTYLLKRVSESLDLSLTVVQSVLQKFQELTYQEVAKGSAVSYINLVSFNPRATRSWNKVKVGSAVLTLKKEVGVQVRLVCTKEFKELVGK